MMGKGLGFFLDAREDIPLDCRQGDDCVSRKEDNGHYRKMGKEYVCE